MLTLREIAVGFPRNRRASIAEATPCRESARRRKSATRAGDATVTDSPYKIVATDQNFMETVVEGSSSRPVLVDFWAPWCGPCRTLMPMLDRIADDYAGRFTLAKLNTDEAPRVAGHLNIRSIPTVMLFRNGEVVDQFVGVQPESAIRAMLDRHLDAPEAAAGAPDPRATAESWLERRDAAAAAEAIAGFAAAHPEHPALPSLRARLAFLEAAVAQPDVPSLRARLERDPADGAARHALAAHHALAGDYATALTEWLELMRRDRKFGDDLARRSLLAAFDVLGETNDLVLATRRRMASLLH
jgi:putative thioredoxin